ncbi:MAG TPA: carboxypeptidase-like regulatory domain-containing protein, partial [Pyrinomonadaceae bacterium]|nr:carboxypeptidase-like regulatory domain-containing protein [Pyrinomonadaceae bacterium]
MGFVVCLRLLIVLLLAIVCSSFASAQTTQTSSRIEGVVRDETGAAIEDADVSLSVASSVVAKTRTEASGRFVFNNLTAREGVLIVKARGFAVAEKIWNANETSPVLIEIILSPAPVTEQVTVTATRTETVLGETAASVVVLSSTEIAATAAATIDDALKQVTGFQLFR